MVLMENKKLINAGGQVGPLGITQDQGVIYYLDPIRILLDSWICSACVVNLGKKKQYACQKKTVKALFYI